MIVTVPNCILLQTIFEYTSRVRYGLSTKKVTDNLESIYNTFSCNEILCKKENQECINYIETKNNEL